MNRQGWADIKNVISYRIFYLLLLPGVMYITIFKYVPMLGILIAFKRYNLSLGFWKSPWVGFENFSNFIHGVYFWDILSNTLIISVYKLIFGFFAPIILALLLNEVTVSWYKKLIQTITYLPHFLSWVVVYALMVALLSPGQGLVNEVIKSIGAQPVDFLTDVHWIRPLIITSDIWKEIGWGAILYLAALTGIDPSLYEAARMDGASRMRQIWHITLPGIRNVIVLLLILRLGYILDVGFDQIFMMENVFNQEKADIIDTWVYREGLQNLQIGLASAVGIFKSVIGFILVISANQIAKKFDGQLW